MPILFDLPTDVALTILMDWLGDTKSLVALDSASARSIRWAYLGLVQDPRFVATQGFKFNANSTAISTWINSRGVKIRGIHMSGGAILVSREYLSAVNSFTLVNDSTGMVTVDSFRALLGQPPSLTSLDMEFGKIDEEHLVALSAMQHLRLRTIKLDNYSHRYRACESVSLLAVSFGSTLEALHLGDLRWVDAATLNSLGSRCSRLKEFSFFIADDITSQELAGAFGPATFPLLQNIIVLTFDSRVNDDVVLALCINHPHLESYIGGSTALSSVAIALTYCPRFRNLHTSAFQFNIVDQSPPQSPYFRLHFRRPTTTVTDLSANMKAITSARFYNSSMCPLRSFSAACKLNNDDIVGVIDTCGKDLHTFNVSVGGDVRHQTLERLFRECTALRILHIKECANLTDDLVMLLVDQCQHVKYLSLAGAVNISNASMCCLMQRMGQRLKMVFLERCSALTDATLVAIVEHCPELILLVMTGTGISAEGVIAYVIKPNGLLKLSEFAIDQETLKVVMDFVKEKDNGANERWQMVL